jgi:hypothetical protein
VAVFAWCEEIVNVSAEILFRSLAGCIYFSRVFFFSLFPLVICRRTLLAVGGNLVTQQENFLLPIFRQHILVHCDSSGDNVPDMKWCLRL